MKIEIKILMKYLTLNKCLFMLKKTMRRRRKYRIYPNFESSKKINIEEVMKTL